MSLSQVRDFLDLPKSRIKFLSKVKQEGDHWIFQGKPSIQGYCYTTLNRKMISAHRVSYMLFKGPILNVVHHTCGIKQCVNPDHLEDITQAENMRKPDGLAARGTASWNSMKKECPKGHQYTTVYERVGESGSRKRRICTVCRFVTQQARNGLRLNIDPQIWLKNNEKFANRVKQPNNNNTLTNVEFDRLMNLFKIQILKSALKINLYDMGLNCYPRRIVQADRWIKKNLTDDQKIDLAVKLGFKLTKTKLRKKLD